MKLIDNRLYISFNELVNSGISVGTIKSAQFRNTSSCWKFIDDPEDKRKVLAEYESLKEDYKKKVIARYGDPYQYVAKMPIRNMVRYDDKAEQYYLGYRYCSENTEAGEMPLPIEHVKKYTWAASYLNLIKDVNEDKRTIKKMLNLSIAEFYEHIMQIFKTDNIDLPTSYKRLVVYDDSALKKYIRDGYDSLIDWRFGKRLAAKVKDEVNSSMLLEMIAHPNQYNDTMVALQYNKWALGVKDEQGNHTYKLIKPATVGVWRRKNAHLITMEREGNSAIKAKYIPVVKGVRPSYPMALVESDDNNLDLLYIELDRKSGDKHSARYVAIVVIDSFNDYVLGYAYAQDLNVELVRMAYINAMYHVKELTGGWHVPHEIKTDNWAIKTLKPFYESVSHFIETPVGSKNRGYIENFFGSTHWKNALKWGSNNYTGNNITAKNRGVNMERLALNKKERPMIGDESEQQVEGFFHKLRMMPDSTGKSKQENWLMAWNNLDATKKRLITEEQFLMKFGFEHLSKNGELPSITNRGCEVQIAGQKYGYDIEGGLPIEHIGKKVHLFYDPMDMSRVLLTDFEKVRLVGKTATYHTKAMVDHTEGSREALNKVLRAKTEAVEKMANASDRRKQVLDSASFSAEIALLEGMMVKDVKRKAENKMIENLSGDVEYDPISQM